MRPTLATLDWLVLGGYVVFAFVIGSLYARKASSGVESFFVGDRKLPWWLAGTSIVATTFAADTPLAVTGIVAGAGISGNWLWWGSAIAQVISTFFFARLWRRAGVITDAEVTELRYGGRPAAALRAFKALYFGLFVNTLTMGWVISAMVKISRAFFDVSPAVVIVICMVTSVCYTTLGGFRSVVVTDFVQFLLSVVGAVALAALVSGRYGGLGAVGDAGPSLVTRLGHVAQSAGSSIGDLLSFVPTGNSPRMSIPLFIVLLSAGWWSQCEGNGYVVQRLAACRDEAQAEGAALWFAVAHHALRPWPWIIVGLAALAVFPPQPGKARSSVVAPRVAGVAGPTSLSVSPGRVDVAIGARLVVRGLPRAASGASVELFGKRTPLRREGDHHVAKLGPQPRSAVVPLTIHAAGATWRAPRLAVELTDREMGYPLLMGLVLPTGLLGLVIASLLAAFMSTIDTHTNWGASYLVQDVYKRFLRPDASERKAVRLSRMAIVLQALLAGFSALFVTSIATVWRFLLGIGAGLGSVSAARWYWWRVTPHAEFTAMGVTTLLAVGLELFCARQLFGGENPLFVFDVQPWARVLVTAVVSLLTWVPVAIFGPRNDPDVLRAFASKVRPPGPGWRDLRDGPGEPMLPALARIGAGLVVVYGTLFGVGMLLFGRGLTGVALVALAAVMLGWILFGKRG